MSIQLGWQESLDLFVVVLCTKQNEGARLLNLSPRTICRRAEWILWVDFSLTYDRAAWHLHRFRMLPNFSTRTNGLKSAFATNQNWAKLPMDCHEAKLGQDYEGLLTEVLPPSLLTRPPPPPSFPPSFSPISPASPPASLLPLLPSSLLQDRLRTFTSILRAIRNARATQHGLGNNPSALPRCLRDSCL